MSYHWYSDKKKRKKGRKKARQRGPVLPVVRKAPSVSLFKGPVDSTAPTWEPAQRLELRQAVSTYHRLASGTPKPLPVPNKHHTSCLAIVTHASPDAC